jgi:hypothetical protein
MSPDIVSKIVSEAGFKIEKSSLEMDGSKSLYYRRDILLILS